MIDDEGERSGGIWPELSFPPEEASLLRACYERANVILEYGSGGSTLLAAEQPGKLVFSVESDRSWAIRLQHEIDKRELPSAATVYHVDIGPTGDWGRPVNGESWMRFHKYPMAIWEEPFFRQPDVVLVDGRFRPACFMAAAICSNRPVTVLFDDYIKRKAYHCVEDFVKPSKRVGRMALFQVEPLQITAKEMGALMDQFFRATYDGMNQSTYTR